MKLDVQKDAQNSVFCTCANKVEILTRAILDHELKKSNKGWKFCPLRHFTWVLAITVNNDRYHDSAVLYNGWEYTRCSISQIWLKIIMYSLLTAKAHSVE